MNSSLGFLKNLEQIRITILTAKELGVDIAAKEDYSMRPAIIPFSTTAEEQYELMTEQ